MIMSALIYDAATGRVDRKVSGPITINPDNQLFSGEAWIVCSDDINESAVYIDISGIEPAIKDRKSYTLDALPMPCVLLIDGNKYEITEQQDMYFEWPGNYVIKVRPSSPEYLDLSFTVNVEESEAVGVL